jgi:Fe(3+) dicitrate transport protein
MDRFGRIFGLTLATAGFLFSQATDNEMLIAVFDPSGNPVTGAAVTLVHLSSGWQASGASGADGLFAFRGIPAGQLRLEVQVSGFSKEIMDLAAPRTGSVEIRLRYKTLAESVQVYANSIAGVSENIPGSAQALDLATLVQSRPLTTEEALRKVPGVHARAEDGFGLRPNIGIRGLNPNRSTRVLLLEDGAPLSYAPYGDNASYYHPPIDRFEAVEIVKGGGQILYGPMTVGGVINYLTPAPPADRAGSLTLTGGNRDYRNAHFRYGGTYRGAGLLFDAFRKQGEGSRDNTRHGLTDLNFKVLRPLGRKQTLSLKFNRYGEDSQITYSGLREAEYAANPRGNPFVHDRFAAYRNSGAATHVWAPAAGFSLRTTGYGSYFNRDWWRQSSNSNQRPNDAADPKCGGMANLLTTCGNEGRLRSYHTGGVETAARTGFGLGALNVQADFGLRGHFETQERRQVNGDTPQARTGLVVENNRRTARAVSGFLQTRIEAGRFRITPGVRLEQIGFARRNRLNGASGETSLTQAIPGLGVSFVPNERWTVFAGAHRGFAPPRVEDVISNATGASLELDPERSWNYEVGFRGRIARALQLEATAFRLDFANQIVPASVAGGVGATLTNAGRTRHQGLEAAGHWNWRNVFRSRHSLSLRAAHTWLPLARFEGVRFSAVPGFGQVSVRGRRLPYAPRFLTTASLGYSHASGIHALFEAVHTGRQFGDDLNTVNPTPDGQRGALPGNTLWNATVNFPVEAWRTTLFVTAKNLTGRTVIVDRSRGILPNAPRLVQGGLQWMF